MYVMTAITHLPSSPLVASGLPLSPEVYRRRRLMVSVLLAVTVFAVSMMGGELLGRVTGVPGSTPAGAAAEPVVYVVQPGDTLWAIAERISPPGRDIRFTVDHLEAVNGGSLLRPGQRLVLPSGW